MDLDALRKQLREGPAPEILRHRDTPAAVVREMDEIVGELEDDDEHEEIIDTTTLRLTRAKTLSKGASDKVYMVQVVKVKRGPSEYDYTVKARYGRFGVRLQNTHTKGVRLSLTQAHAAAKQTIAAKTKKGYKQVPNDMRDC